MSKAKIIYFINGSVPSADDLANAEKIQGVVVFRNVKFILPEDAAEPCDGVAGAVPKQYLGVASAESAVAHAAKEENATQAKIDAIDNEKPLKPTRSKAGVDQ